MTLYTELCSSNSYAEYMCVCSIGKGLGYKKSELSGLTEGSMLIIGGKEIEVFLYVLHMSLTFEPTPHLD